MDTTNRRPQLPALSYLDVEKVKREDEAAYQNRNTGTPQSLSASAGASPTYHYPPGPPPPYSHAHGPPTQHTNTYSANHAAVHTPPESRRTSENEKDGIKQTARQSLPSISEALGVDSQTSFASAPTLPPPSLQPSHLSQPQSTGPASPSPNLRRSYPMEPPQAPANSLPTSNSYSHYGQYRPEQQQHQAYPPPSEANRTTAVYPSAQDSKPPVHPQTSQPSSRPSQTSLYARAAEPASTYEPPHAHSNGSMGPPSSFPYGYTPYPSRYTNATPPASATSGPIYQPSTVYGAPPTDSPGWKSDKASRYDGRQPSQASYGENVKRHLDLYDLEMALNEIGTSSGILSDFSRRYGDRMHQTQRSGASLNSLPGLVEVDDMVSKSRVQLDALLKIREVIIAQQAAYEQQAADQRHQRKSFSEAPQPAPEQHAQEMEENKQTAFADTKKRRGRAAPPGRCHSCNRAETPEWRRGPDGARTLCNACGLHYAKLTRKNNGASKTTSVGSSNLRPKET